VVRISNNIDNKFVGLFLDSLGCLMSHHH